MAEQRQLIVDVQREKATLHEERLRVGADQDALQKGAMELQRKAEDKMRECAIKQEEMTEIKNDLELRERKVIRFKRSYDNNNNNGNKKTLTNYE